MSDTPPGTTAADGAAAPADGAEVQADDCANCLGPRSILLALAFAAFAAYVAADFATGGRVTAAALGLVAAVRGRAEGADGG